VPTGNFGDAYAGWAARRMGLPIERITVVTNANDIVARALSLGDYRRGPAIATQSPAMDIQAASNFERLHFEYAGRGNLETAGAFEAFARTGALKLPDPIRAAMAEVFDAASVSEAETSAAMRRIWESTGQLIDPHTAVAVAGADKARARAPGAPLVILSTAHPAKFPEAVFAATGQTPAAPAAAARLKSLAERLDRLPAQAEAVKAYVRAWS
jgi:threonine synthase